MYSRVKTIASIDVGRTYLAVSVWRKASGDGLGQHHGIEPMQVVGGENEEEEGDFEYYHGASGQTYVYPKDKFRLIYLDIDEFTQGSAPWQPIHLRHPSQQQDGSSCKRKSTVRVPLNTRAACVYGLIRKYMSVYSPDIIFVEDQLNVANENKLVQCCIIAAGSAVRVISVPPMAKFDFKTTKMQTVASMRKSKGREKELKTIAMNCMNVIVGEENRAENNDDLEIEYDIRGIDIQSVRTLYPVRIYYTLDWYHKDLADCVLQGIQCISKMISSLPSMGYQHHYGEEEKKREEDDDPEKTSSRSASLVSDDYDDDE